MTMNDTIKKFEETLLLNCIANPSYAKKMVTTRNIVTKRLGTKKKK